MRRRSRRETTTHMRLRSTGRASGRPTHQWCVIVTLLRNTAA